MTKALKYVAVGFAVVVGLNLLTWAVIGRESILLRAPRFFDRSCPVLDLDTLRVYSHYVEDAETPERSSIGDFGERSRRALLDSLSARSESVVVYRDTTVAAFPDSERDVHFAAWIDRRFPFYAHVIAAETALGFAADYDQHWVWAFGWRPVGFGGGGCS